MAAHRIIRTTYAGPTDTRGSRIIVTGPWGQFTVSYNYSAYCPHDAAVVEYLARYSGSLLMLADADGRRRTLSRSGRGYRYTLADGDPRGAVLIP